MLTKKELRSNLTAKTQYYEARISTINEKHRKHICRIESSEEYKEGKKIVEARRLKAQAKIDEHDNRLLIFDGILEKTKQVPTKEEIDRSYNMIYGK